MSGPPGSGKSTTAQFMARNHGYVYYDVDCFALFSNPFVDLFAKEASLTQDTQIPLKVVHKHFYKTNSDTKNMILCFLKDIPRDIVDVIQRFTSSDSPENIKSEQQLVEIEFPYFEEVAKHIIKQRKRLGGDWV